MSAFILILVAFLALLILGSLYVFLFNPEQIDGEENASIQKRDGQPSRIYRADFAAKRDPQSYYISPR